MILFGRQGGEHIIMSLSQIEEADDGDVIIYESHIINKPVWPRSFGSSSSQASGSCHVIG
jgi:hypothetical protein